MLENRVYLQDPNLILVQDLRNRKVPFTYVFVALNLFVFLLIELAGGAQNEATLLAAGVKSNIAIDQGEYWRLVTPVFIHIGFLHLALNCYALWIVGRQVERLYGSALFVIMYLLMGIAGVIGSYLYHPEAISAGASGAIFGLFGVLLIFGVRNRSRVPAFVRRAIGAGILPIIVLNLLIGFLIPVIDNAAHIGGLLSGIALASVFGFKSPGSRTSPGARAGQVVSLCSVVASFALVLAHYDGPPIRASNLGRWIGFGSGTDSAQQFIEAINASQRSFARSRLALSDSTDPATLDRLSTDLAEAIEQLSRADPLTAESDTLVDSLRKVLERQYALLDAMRRSDVRPGESRELMDRYAADYGAAMDDVLEWVEQNGAPLGLQVRQPGGGGP